MKAALGGVELVGGNADVKHHAVQPTDTPERQQFFDLRKSSLYYN